MSPIRPGDLLAVAHIVRPHGIRGEVSAIPLAPPVLEASSLILGRKLVGRDAAGSLQTFSAISFRVHQDRWLIQLADVNDRTQADALRGIDLCLRRDELPPLPEGWYWEADLEQCRVIDRRMGVIGLAEGLDTARSQPHLIVLRPDGRRASVPWRSGLIRTVDIDDGLIETDLPDGFPGVSD